MVFNRYFSVNRPSLDKAKIDTPIIQEFMECDSCGYKTIVGSRLPNPALEWWKMIKGKTYCVECLQKHKPHLKPSKN